MHGSLDDCDDVRKCFASLLLCWSLYQQNLGKRKEFFEKVQLGVRTGITKQIGAYCILYYHCHGVALLYMYNYDIVQKSVQSVFYCSPST